MDDFDSEERAREKQAARDRDAAALASGEMTPEELRRKNGAFTHFARAPIDFAAMPRRAR